MLSNGSYLLSNSATSFLAYFCEISYTGQICRTITVDRCDSFVHLTVTQNQEPLSGVVGPISVQFYRHSEDQNRILFCFGNSSLLVFLSVFSVSTNPYTEGFRLQRMIGRDRWRGNRRPVFSRSRPSKWRRGAQRVGMVNCRLAPPSNAQCFLAVGASSAFSARLW